MQILDDTDLLEFMGTQESQFFVQPSELLDKIKARLNHDGSVAGDLLPWSKTHKCVGLRPGEVSIWVGINGHGKALCLETDIPTLDGWKKLADIHPGDIIFDEKGKQCKVVAETDVQINRPCYEIEFSDGTKIIADAEHEWLTATAQARHSTRNAKMNNLIKLRGLKKTGTDQTWKRTFPAIVTTKQISENVRVEGGCWRGKLQHSIPDCNSLETSEKILPIDPYIFGLWLGDGHSSGYGFTTADTSLLVYFTNAGYRVTKHANKYAYGICGGFLIKLRESNLINNKHIPDIYMRSSYKQRLSLLQGLMDSDGHITDYGRCEFCNTNKDLAEKTLELVLTLGLQAKMITGRAMLYGKDCGEKYRVTFTPNVPVFKLERKLKFVQADISDRVKQRFIIRCEPVKSVPVKCIQVDSESHLFLASKAFIPTHNSLVLGQVCAWSLDKTKWLIASMEMLPEATMERMAKQTSGNGKPSDSFLEKLLCWTDDRLWIYDQTDTVKTDRILAVIHYAANKLGVNHIVIDSLIKCGIKKDDLNGQSEFVDRLCWAAKKNMVHIHLVHHVRKGDKETNIPDKFDVRGAGEITDLVDNVFIIHRNKSKEGKIRRKEEVSEDEPDTRLIVAKQRHGEWEGHFNLWFHPGSTQFTPSPGNQVMRYFI